MRHKDIEPGGLYLAGKDGTSHYSPRAKCRVVGPVAVAGLPLNQRRRLAGQRVWEVEWLADASRGLGHGIKAGTRSIVTSAWILRPWTEQDDEALDQDIENARRNQALLARFTEAFGLEVPGNRRFEMVREDAPTVTMGGAQQAAPSFTLSAAAVELVLETLERVRLEGVED